MIKKILILFLSSLLISEALLYISSSVLDYCMCISTLKLLSFFINPFSYAYCQSQIFELEPYFIRSYLAYLLAWYSLLVFCYEYKNKFKITKYLFWGGILLYLGVFLYSLIFIYGTVSPALDQV